MNMLGEGNQTEDRVNVQDRHTMFPVDNKANYVDLLHYARKRLQRADECLGPSICVQRKLADDLWMQR